MALNPSNSSNLEQLALNGLTVDAGWTDDGWRETMSQDRHDRAAAADTGRLRGRPSSSRGQRGGWGPRSSRGRRQQCKLSVVIFC